MNSQKKFAEGGVSAAKQIVLERKKESEKIISDIDERISAIVKGLEKSESGSTSELVLLREKRDRLVVEIRVAEELAGEINTLCGDQKNNFESEVKSASTPKKPNRARAVDDAIEFVRVHIENGTWGTDKEDILIATLGVKRGTVRAYYAEACRQLRMVSRQEVAAKIRVLLNKGESVAVETKDFNSLAQTWAKTYGIDGRESAFEGTPIQDNWWESESDARLPDEEEDD